MLNPDKSKSTSIYIRIILDSLGRRLPFENDKGHISFRIILVAVLGFSGVIQAAIRTYIFWNDLAIRVDEIIYIVIYFFCSLAALQYAQYPDRYNFMLDIIEKPIYNCNCMHLTKEQREIRKKVDNTENYIRIAFYASAAVWTLKSIRNTIEGIILILKCDKMANINTLDLKMAFMSIPTTKIFQNSKLLSTLLFGLVSTIQTLFLLMLLVAGCTWCLISTCVIKKLEAEVKLHCTTIKLMEKWFHGKDLLLNDENESSEFKKMNYLKHLIMHHQKIIRYTHLVNGHLSNMMLIFNNVIAISLGLKFYLILEGEGQLADVSDAIGAFICFSAINYVGQGLIDQSNCIISELFYSSWLDQPQWFKKYVIIKMICAQRHLQMKPSLYVLSLTNVLMVVQAAFSYYNVISNLRSRN